MFRGKFKRPKTVLYAQRQSYHRDAGRLTKHTWVTRSEDENRTENRLAIRKIKQRQTKTGTKESTRRLHLGAGYTAQD